MNYHHQYHAGNFADVFKHCILILLQQFLAKKTKPILYLDTHAGNRLYDLTSVMAQKSYEYKNGIARIYDVTTCPQAVKTYLEIVKAENSNSTLGYYPGSSRIMQVLLRPQDTMILIELALENAKQLKYEFHDDKRVAVHHVDGYQSIKAFLPPEKGRGLIFIDPPFEEKDEFTRIIQALEVAYQRFPIGIYAIWYPIKDTAVVENFHRELKLIGFPEIITTQITIANKSQMLGLTSCGMAIINPPWNFANELNILVSWLDSNLCLIPL